MTVGRLGYANDTFRSSSSPCKLKRTAVGVWLVGTDQTAGGVWLVGTDQG